MVIFGIVSVIYGILLKSRNPDYQSLPFNYIFLGVVFTISSIFYLLNLNPILIAITFFGGMITIISITLIFRKKIEQERSDHIIKRLKKIDKDEKIKIFDIYRRIFIYKLMLKKGPKYAAKVITLTTSLPLATILTINYYIHDYTFYFLVINFILAFSIYSLLFYTFMKSLFEETYDKYNQKYSDEKLFDDSFDYR